MLDLNQWRAHLSHGYLDPLRGRSHRSTKVKGDVDRVVDRETSRHQNFNLSDGVQIQTPPRENAHQTWVDGNVSDPDDVFYNTYLTKRKG